ncbi:mobile mystery protein A [uncultured Brevundimonas sp.]|uniref:mobile mystery protein A n=1 Tax=uncultured Brevundimonas sp. TaxID=213418 RepID=UPI0026128D5D|nr:mobile mystery protein A [uncultured Brevundimonas sp.]
MEDRQFARKSLDARLANWRMHDPARPHRGWLRAIREALGMTFKDVAQRMGVSEATVSGYEKREADDSITLGSLRRAAEAMNCRLVYAIVPETSLEQVVRDRAARIVDERLARVGHTMSLENQGVPSTDFAHERERMIDALLRDEPRSLWRIP